MKTYLVKDIFGPTLQGEGAHAGRPCVFLRFAVCNIECHWCDTDFAPQGARKLSAEQVREELLDRDRHGARMVVVTGGEPALQWDTVLARALADAGFRVHMETNGTKQLRAPVDWLTVSPKPQFHAGKFSLVSLDASECKLVVDDTVSEDDLARYESLYDTESLYLQPCMDDRYDHHLARTLKMLERQPRWRLSLQIHKIVGIP